MAYEPRRTLLVGLSALAVVFAAALFPAAGVGSHPGGSVGVPGDPGPVDTPTEPPDTPTPEQTEERNPSTDTPTETPTDTPTDTPAPGSNDSGGDALSDLSLMALLGVLAKSLGALLVGAAVLALALVVRGAEPGTPRVELPFGLTITLPFTVPEWVGGFTTRVSRLTMGFVVSISASVTQLLDAMAAALQAVTGGLGIALGEGLRGTAKLLGTLPAAIAGAFTGLAALPRALGSVPGLFSTVGGTISGSSDVPDEDARATAPDPVSDEASDDDEGPRTVTELWVAMTDLLPVSYDRATTPREFARRAVDRGVPAGPVTRITRAFEEVVYGGYEPGERAAAARDAFARLRKRLGGDA